MGEKRERAVLPLTYETYVFDLYGTLVDIRTDEGLPLVWEKLALLYGYYGAIYTPGELQARYGALVHAREREMKYAQEAKYAHEASPEIELTEVFRDLFREKGVEAEEALAVHAGQFMRILSTDHVCLYPGTRELLAFLKEQGKKVYLLSNAQRIFTAFEMNTLDISRFFDDILISSDYGTRKPDRCFFQLLLDRHGIDPEKTLFVGNDSHTDIAGAQAVGLDTYYVNSNISPQGDAAPHATYFVEDFHRWERE